MHTRTQPLKILSAERAYQPASSTTKRWSPQRVLSHLFAINPLLTILGIAMIVTLLGTFIGLLIDQRVITGAPAWLKPAKFAISFVFYCFTFVWMLGFIKGHQRLVSFVANVTGIIVVLEFVMLVIQVVRGVPSHFNISTPFDSMMFSAMGNMIVVFWVMGLIAALLLLFQRMENPTFAWSLRLGILLSLVGMLIGFLMTQPTPQQLTLLQNDVEIAAIGAHSVGVVDGGPGLPLVGWSTTGGDLRIGHFIGLHSLQLLPLLGWLLTRRSGGLLRMAHKVSLVWIIGLSYLGVMALATWQALRGQSIIAPDALTITAAIVLVGTTILAMGIVLSLAWERRTKEARRNL